MKNIIMIFALLSSISLYGQGKITGGNGDSRVSQSFQRQHQALIDSFRNSRNDQQSDFDNNAFDLNSRNNRDVPSDPTRGDDSRPGKITGGNGSTQIPTPDRQYIDLVQDSLRQIDSRRLTPNKTGPSDKIEVPDTTKKRTAPMRLYFDQIHFESDDVSEVTLKDGTVVKTEELQDFAKEVIIKKLNEQK